MNFRAFVRLALDPFVLGMIGALLLGSLLPDWGASGGPLQLDRVTDVGVGLVFFLAGAGLSLEKLKAGATNLRLHLFIQSSTYLLFPLLGLIIVLAVGRWLPPELMSGLFFLCAVSSTISTSIAMTSLARGNVAGAVFNATLSSLLGLVLTPLLMNLWLQTAADAQIPLLDQFVKIARQLFLPLAAGQLARPLIGAWIARNKAWTARSDRAVILLIVYHAFCDSVRAGLWTDYGWPTLLETLLLTAVLLALVLTLTTALARRLKFSAEDEIAAVFCGSKKSIAVGIPMAKLLMGSAPLGLIVLPLMFYHQLQLIVCTVLAQRYARRP